MRRQSLGLGGAFSGLVVLAVYVNVVADNAPIRAHAEDLAREHAGCGSQCHVARMQERRDVLGYHADFDIGGAGTIHITCRRAAIVVGEHECTVW